jgi:Carboxypeptidase regulatory-like domain
MPRFARRWLLTTLLLSNIALAQRDLGTVTGTITDASGAAVPNATVTILEGATGLSYTTTSSESGSYSRPALKPGTYTITVQAPGFQKAQQKDVVVNPGAPTAANISLQVGNATETVEVTAAAPLLQTESPVIGANLNAAQMAQLPMGGQRTFAFLARMAPGVLPAENGARDALGGGFSANGVRSTGENNFLLNGVDNNVNVIDFINQTSFVISPSLEAIGEMQILTNGYNAEYGRAAGGVVNVNLKSGTNQVHGVVFEILQNEKLNANRWENNLGGKPVNPFKQNQFGGALGGPIIKNKLFIFGDYQGTRIASAGGSVQNLGYGNFMTIPTQAMIHGDFSRLLGASIGTDPITGQSILANQLYDPRSTACVSGCAPGSLAALGGATPVYTRAPFVRNQIPVSIMDPASVKIASLYPAENQPVAAGKYPQNDYFAPTPGSLGTDQGDGRVDYRINEKNSIFGSLSWSNTNKTSVPPFPGILDGTDFNGIGESDLGRNAQISYTRIWSPTILSETRVGFTRLVTARSQPNSDVNVFAAVGIGGYNPFTSATANGGLPQIQLQDTSNSNRYRTVGSQDWLPTKEYNNVWDFIQNVAISKNSHSMKFGAEYRPIKFPFAQWPYPRGEMNFNQNETAYPSTVGSLNTLTGDPVASFLLGSLGGGQISTTNFISSMKQAWAFYAQDDWKVTPKLTLNLGVRYELFSPIGERFGRQSNFVLQDLTLYIPEGRNQDAPLPPNFNSPITTAQGITFPALFTTPIKVDRGSVDKYLIPWDKTNIGPRIGLAYNVLPKTVIRAAYGIFYGGEENQGGNPNRGEAAPFNSSPQLNRPGSVGIFQPNPFFANGNWTGAVSAGYPTNVFSGFPLSSLQFRSVATDFRNPMVQKWNLAIQQQLPGQMALELTYIGNHSSHQLLQPDFNNCYNLATANSRINCNSLRRYPDIGSISGTATWGFGNYNGMTAKLEKRLTAGLQFVTAYTYGHALANSGTTLSGSSGLYTKDPTNYNSSYTNASWDIRHNFTTAINYDLPFGRGKQYAANWNRAMDLVAGNWRVNAVMTFHSGQPFTLRDNRCTGVWSGCSPDLAPGTDPNAAPANGRNPDQWFNTANLLRPAFLTQGNLGLQTNYGPPTRTVDFSIFKDFPITERWRVEFRAESFNIGNTPQFSLPENNAQNTNFGRVTATAPGSERKTQFQLRLQF